MELDRSAGKLLYMQIHDILYAEIKNGLYAGSDMLPSEKELCLRFNVERNTVRKALHLLVQKGLIIKRPGYGTMLTAAAVLGIPKKTVSNPALATRRNILLITQKDYIEDNGEYFHFKLRNNIDKNISDMGYNLIFKSVSKGNGLAEIIQHTNPVAIIYDSYMHNEVYHEGIDAGIACISINHYTPLMTSVVSNNFDGASRVAEMLLEAGHTKIAILTGKKNYQTNTERMNGVQALCQKKGFILDNRLIMTGDWLFSSGMKMGESILNMPESERPTAVFAFNDDMAYGCYSCFERNGIRVPEDISVVGFDRSDRYHSIFPPITTVDVNIDAIIEYSCWFLSRCLNGTSPQVHAKIQIDTEFIDKGTILNRKN